MSTGSASPALVAAILAFPVAMTLATGIEAPRTSIAQLGQPDDDERRRFGRGTLLLTVAIVGAVTRGYPLLSPGATAAISASLDALWCRASRPSEIDL